jgi:uncharacterized protein (DUF111 family)
MWRVRMFFRKIKNILIENGITLRNRGAQVGTENSMYGKKRGPNNNFTGKIHSKESKLKISKNWNGKTTRILINNIEYESIRSASKQLNIPASTIGRWLRENKTVKRNGVIYNIKEI